MRKKGSHMIRLRKALLLLATAPLAVPTVAWAQDALPAEPGTGGDQAIVVTGSRLPSTDLTGPAPVTILDRTEIDNTGSTSVGELLRELPVASASASRSEEHTSELQSLMRNSYAVFCLKKN